MNNIKIGTLIRCSLPEPQVAGLASYMKKLLPYGFETFMLHWGSSYLDGTPDRLLKIVEEVLKDSTTTISALSVFGNLLEYDEAAELGRKNFADAICRAHDFGCDLVTGFAGRINNTPIPANIERFKEVWSPLAELAQKHNVRIAFENCNMEGNWNYGSWNIAICPDAWELMFDAVPAENVGLQWEPAHQMTLLIDPLPQIREWGKKIFNVHGKDATIRHDIIAKHGFGGKECAVWHRTPGFGDCDWRKVITELRLVGYQGSIDIEGWHDPVYKDELEITGQIHALNYLKRCRGGELITL